jgi:hypothetical protein
MSLLLTASKGAAEQKSEETLDGWERVVLKRHVFDANREISAGSINVEICDLSTWATK